MTTEQETARELLARAERAEASLERAVELVARAELLLSDVYTARGGEDWFDRRDAWIIDTPAQDVADDAIEERSAKDRARHSMGDEKHVMVHLAGGGYTCLCGDIYASTDQRDVFIHLDWALRQERDAAESRALAAEAEVEKAWSYALELDRAWHRRCIERDPDYRAADLEVVRDRLREVLREQTAALSEPTSTAEGEE